MHIRHTVLATLAVVVGVALATSGALADQRSSTAKPAPCGDAKTTLAMTECLSKANKAISQELGRAYERVRTALRGADRAALESVQRRWISFRRADCEFAASRYRQGTQAPVARLDCILTQTKRRLADMHAYAYTVNG